MMRAGACDYVGKQNLSRLAPAVERALQDAAARRDRRSADDTARRLADIVQSSSDLGPPDRVAEERFRLLVETIPHMVWMADADGSTDFLNQRGATVPRSTCSSPTS